MTEDTKILLDALQDFAGQMYKGLQEVNVKIDKLDSHLTKIENKLDSIDSHLTKIENKLDSIDTHPN